jgi:hypothetical protein
LVWQHATWYRVLLESYQYAIPSQKEIDQFSESIEDGLGISISPDNVTIRKMLEKNLSEHTTCAYIHLWSDIELPWIDGP